MFNSRRLLQTTRIWEKSSLSHRRRRRENNDTHKHNFTDKQAKAAWQQADVKYLSQCDCHGLGNCKDDAPET